MRGTFSAAAAAATVAKILSLPSIIHDSLKTVGKEREGGGTHLSRDRDHFQQLKGV